MRYFISLLAGSLSVAAFAPFKLSFITFFALAWLFYAIVNSTSKKQAFLNAFLFGMGLFGFGVSWIYISLHSFGNMVPALAIFMVFLLILLFSFTSGLAGFAHFLFFRSNQIVSYAIALPSLWVVSEWVREWILTGFPWMFFGYTQTDNFLASQATISGILGVSLVTAICAGLLNLVVQKRVKVKVRAIIALLVILAAHFMLNKIEWATENGTTKKIQLVQANVPIEDKWKSEKVPAIIADYFRLTREGATGEKADITVWPEAAIPYALHDAGAVIEKAKTEGINILTGIVEVDPETNNYYNVIAYLPGIDLKNPETYRKRHLVPFGEYIPMQKLLAPILSSLEIPMSDLTANRDSSPNLVLDDINVGLSICYEDAFATEMSDAIDGDISEQANILINVSEDAWFGDSLAPHQRLQMAQMRALENARYLVRVSNNGLSAFINDKGEIVDLTPQFIKTSLTRDVPMLTGTTIFARYGNIVILSTLAFLLLLSLMIGFAKPDKKIKQGLL